MDYIHDFYQRIDKEWHGSLISVREARRLHQHAKEYLAQAAREGLVERVTWGWYFVPAPYRDAVEFLKQDKHFKVLHKQTAAGIWNADFVHHDHYTVAVSDASYARALQAFAEQRGWNITVETRRLTKKDYVKIGDNYVEGLEPTIISCLKAWAFTDAFAALHEHERDVRWRKLAMHAWERIPRTNARIGQLLTYGTKTLHHEPTRANITDDFLKRQVDEALEKVVDLA